MADIIELDAAVRERVGKGAAREARRQGRVPAVIYGDKKNPEPISLEYKTVFMQVQTGNFLNTLYMINVDGNKTRVIPRDVQFDPVRDFPMHVDFLRLSKGASITIEVTVNFINEEECPGLKAGGVLNVVRYAVEVTCPAEAIPENFEADLTGLELGDSIHISAITLPDGVVPTITDRDFTVATIAAPAGLDREGADEEAVDGEEVEGEEAETEAEESTEE
jgi:large subunit ribosomal protein L25